MARGLAVLIDADNVPVRVAKSLFSTIATLGQPKICRVYGASTQTKPWPSKAPKLPIHRRKIGTSNPGKNAADIALVVDAMDLIHDQHFESFCIVSSDGDFTRLARRLREQSCIVFGFGGHKAPEGFQKACDKFFFFEGV